MTSFRDIFLSDYPGVVSSLDQPYVYVFLYLYAVFVIIGPDCQINIILYTRLYSMNVRNNSL